MATKYNYSIPNTFPYQKANLPRLIEEIGVSSISGTLNYANVDTNDCDIVFEYELSVEDLATLSGIVDGHSGEPFDYSDAVYSESEGESTTTSTVWQQKLRMNISDFPPGTYQIRWYMEYRE